MATITSTLPTPAEIGSLVARAVDTFNDPARWEEYLDIHHLDVVAYGMVPEAVGFDGCAPSTSRSGPACRTRRFASTTS
jgi:hypothetical protein